ncbi:MAG: MBL fold metallo-hydrolase [Kineosporiaceae bacterium]|nr:MBL fold metallo-hydrolase [Kineosporiaceae bacterium]
MTVHLTRRQLVVSATGVLGVALLGTGCSAAGDPAGPTGPSPSGTPSGPASPAGSPVASPSGAAGPAAAAGLRWERADLSFVSAYLLVRGSEVAIVDLGTAGSDGAIRQVLASIGLGWDAVRHIVLTHRHGDHVGGLAAVAPQVRATVYAGAQDVAAIDSPVPIAGVRDGQEVFGLQVIASPGHTAGHICIFDPATGVLVAGDALRTTAGLAPSDPQFTEDAAGAAASVKRLATLPVRVILPGHGDPLTEGAAEALTRLAATL